MRDATEEDIGIDTPSRKDNARRIAGKKIRKSLKDCMALGLSLGEAETVIRRTFLKFCDDYYAHAAARKAAAE